MGLMTETMIWPEGDTWVVHEVLAGSEDASAMPIGELRRVLPFATWAFIGKEGCELDESDLQLIARKLAELKAADRGKSRAELKAELGRTR